MLQIPGLYIHSEEERNRGVYCSQDIQSDDIIEVCPIIIIPTKDVPIIHQTAIHDYYFMWQDNKAAIALGFGSLYNHAHKPNAKTILDYNTNEIIIQAISNIQAGDQIFISYNDGLQKESGLWFDVK